MSALCTLQYGLNNIIVLVLVETLLTIALISEKEARENIASRTSDKSEYPDKMTKSCKRSPKGGLYTGPAVGTLLLRRDIGES